MQMRQKQSFLHRWRCWQREVLMHWRTHSCEFVVRADSTKMYADSRSHGRSINCFAEKASSLNKLFSRSFKHSNILTGSERLISLCCDNFKLTWSRTGPAAAARQATSSARTQPSSVIAGERSKSVKFGVEHFGNERSFQGSGYKIKKKDVRCEGKQHSLQAGLQSSTECLLTCALQ